MKYDLVIIGDTYEAEYAIKRAKEQGILNAMKLPLLKLLQLQQIRKQDSIQLLVYETYHAIDFIEAKSVMLANGGMKKNGRYLPDYEFLHANGFQMNNQLGGVKVNEMFETSIPNVYACGNILYYHNSIHKLQKEIDIAISYLKKQLLLS